MHMYECTTAGVPDKLQEWPSELTELTWTKILYTDKKNKKFSQTFPKRTISYGYQFDEIVSLFTTIYQFLLVLFHGCYGCLLFLIIMSGNMFL